MNYEIIETTDVLTGVKTEHLFITYADGSTKSMPALESNPEYVDFINSQENN